MSYLVSCHQYEENEFGDIINDWKFDMTVVEEYRAKTELYSCASQTFLTFQDQYKTAEMFKFGNGVKVVGRGPCKKETMVLEMEEK